MPYEGVIDDLPSEYHGVVCNVAFSATSTVEQHRQHRQLRLGLMPGSVISDGVFKTDILNLKLRHAEGANKISAQPSRTTVSGSGGFSSLLK